MSISSFEQQRRSTRHEMRIIDAVLEHLPSAASSIEDISKSIRPIIQGLVQNEPPTPDLTSKALKKSMHFLNTELDEYREELSSLRVQLTSKTSQLKEITGERDRCRKALEEAHACVSDYHKKLSTMERTVGHALVSRGELKEATTNLEEAKSLNQQYKETLAAADIRLETMEETITEQKEQVSMLESRLEAEKDKASNIKHDRLQLSRRVEEVKAELGEVQARLADAERQRDAAREEAGDVGQQHAETLAALSDLITIQKRSDTERGGLEVSLREQQTSLSKHEATIEALRAQLEAARHAPLRAAADGACGGVKFGGAAHGGASQAAGRAATALADALPGLSDALQEEVQEGAGPPGCSSDGSPGGAGRQSGRAGCAQGCGAGQQAGSTDVFRAADSLRQLKQLLDRASMFHEADDAQQTLYGSLRDLWAALEVRLADALPGVAAVVGQARDAAREARHRQDHLRAALRDTHDALARATAERHRAKQLASDLQEQLDAEQQHMADEVGAAQSAARVDALRREDELRAARGRAAELDAALLQEQADAQRLRDEHEHQLHSLQVEMRTRFAMLRDSYQHQLDTLHVQVADIEATCKLPRLPRMGDGFAAAPAPRGEVAGHMGAGPRHGSGGAAERAHWDHGGRRSPELQETPEHARPRVRDGRERPGLRGGETGTGEARSWGEQEFWEAGAAQQDALCAQSAESGRGSSDAPHAAPAPLNPPELQWPQARSYSPSPRKPLHASNPLLPDTPGPACDTPEHDHHARSRGSEQPPGRGASAPPRPATSRGRHMQVEQRMQASHLRQAGRGPEDHRRVDAADDGGCRLREGYGAVQVPTQPSRYPSSTSGEVLGIFAEDPPLQEPAPGLSHLESARAPRHTAESQSHPLDSPYSTLYTHRDLTPPARHDAAPHAAAQQSAQQAPRHCDAAPNATAQYGCPTVPGSSPETPYDGGLAWGMPIQSPWQGGAPPPQRPHTARPSRGIGDAGLASPEAILLATQHEGREGRVRPQSARPSDHWPAGGAPGQLQARRRPSPTAGPPARTPRAPARSSASRRPATRPATTPSPAPPSHTESAVLAALKKSGLLERLGNGSTPDRAASSVKRKKTVKTTKTVRGRSRTPKQGSLWLL